jgi:hypothetical protein
MPLVAGGATNTKVKFKIKKKRDLLACPAVQFILLALIRMMYLGRIGCSCIILLGSKDFMGSCS